MKKRLRRLIVGKDKLTFDENLRFLYMPHIDDIDDDLLGYFYFDFKRAITHFRYWLPNARFDQAGVLASGHGNSRWGKTLLAEDYNPINISIFALGNHALYLDTGEKAYRDALMTQTKWLVDNQQVFHYGARRGRGWEANYYYFAYSTTPPWRSAMIQGLAISALLRAYHQTDEKDYLEAALDAMVPYSYTVHEGGVCALDSDGNAFYEEFAVEPGAHILNGHIFALWGLYDLYRATANQEAAELFQRGCTTLQNTLHCYDTGYWSRYDLLLCPPALARYHRIHIEQLNVLHAMTGNPVFRATAERWMTYWNSMRSQIIYSFLFRTRLGYWRFGLNWLVSRMRWVGSGKVQGELSLHEF